MKRDNNFYAGSRIIKIKKSKTGRFIIFHKCNHYHKLLSNVLLHRDVASSGNMYRRNSHFHFLNVKMASYAVPSFSENVSADRDIVYSDEGVKSGIMQELYSGQSLSVYLNLCKMVNTTEVRYVHEGRFYKIHDLNGTLSTDSEMPNNEYPRGIYYGWFDVNKWVVRTKTGTGSIQRTTVRGWLIQRHDGKRLCGRIVTLNDYTKRKRTNNQFSREIEYPAEHGGRTQIRIPSRSFVPIRPCVYIPFHLYNALPYMDAFIPVNFPDPLSPRIQLRTEFSMSYSQHTLMMYEGIVSGVSSGTQNIFTEDPKGRTVTIVLELDTTKVNTSTPSNRNLVQHIMQNFNPAFEEWKVPPTPQHPENNRYQIDLDVLIKLIQNQKCKYISKALTVEQLCNLFQEPGSSQLKNAIQKYSRDLAAYNAWLKTQHETKPSLPKGTYYGNPVIVKTPLYENGVQVQSKVEKKTKYQTFKFNVFYSPLDRTISRYTYDPLLDDLVLSTTTVSTSLPPVSCLMLGGKPVTEDFALSSPKAVVYIRWMETQRLETLQENSGALFDPVSYAKTMFNNGDTTVPQCPRINLNSTTGDLDSLNVKGFSVILQSPVFSEGNNLDVGTDYIVFFNPQGKVVWAEYNDAWEKASKTVHDVWEAVYEKDPDHASVNLESEFPYIPLFNARIKSVVEGYSTTGEDGKHKLSENARAELIWRVKNNTIPINLVNTVQVCFSIENFHKGLYNTGTMKSVTNNGSTHIEAKRIYTTIYNRTNDTDVVVDSNAQIFATQWIPDIFNSVAAGMLDLSQEPVLLDKNVSPNLHIYFGPYSLHQNIGDATFGSQY